MHFEGFLPAALCDLDAKPLIAELVGAKESEVRRKKNQIPKYSGMFKPFQVCMMNSLTVNLHLAMQVFPIKNVLFSSFFEYFESTPQAFYRPNKESGRVKIMFEAHAFPSDRVNI